MWGIFQKYQSDENSLTDIFLDNPFYMDPDSFFCIYGAFYMHNQNTKFWRCEFHICVFF